MKKIIQVLFIFFALTGFAKAQTTYTDSLALVALYNSTNGAGWTDKSNWLTGNVSTWYGIEVSGDRVTQIYINSNNLVGTIPPEIGNLTNLTNLELYENQLSGVIPTEIGNLTNLTNINLSWNQLTSSIPTEIGNLINLTSLYLNSNQLSGSIPTEIGNLTNLTYLYLYDNQLSGSIPDLTALVNLWEYSIYNNYYTFNDLEPVIAGYSNLYYTPQLNFPVSPGDHVVAAGGNISLDATSLAVYNLGGSNNLYEWFLNGNSLGAASGNPVYSKTNITVADMGIYTCQVTNTVVTSLMLYSEDIRVGQAMVYNSSTVTQNTAEVALGTTQQQIIGIEINLTDLVNPLSVSSFNLNTTGTTNTGDISNARLFYTGTDNYFNTGNQYGSTQTGPNGVFTINGSQILSEGINYFWLTYDIDINATVGNAVDAECTQVTVAGINRTPFITAPTGSRVINIFYCESEATETDDTETDEVIFGSISNNTAGICATYSDFTSISTDVYRGSTYNLSVTAGTCGENYDKGTKVYIDWNRNESFEETNEEVAAFGITDSTNTYTVDVTVPATASIGSTRMRVVTNEVSSLTEISSCGTYDWGETEDYTINIVTSNNAPQIANPIADQNLNQGFGSTTIDPTNVFSDADSDPLTYTVSSNNTAVVTVSVSGTTLTITEVGIGTADITVTANDGNGGTVDDVFAVTVNTGSENDILSFGFPEQTGAATIDDVNHTVDIEVTYGTDVTTLVATFTISALANITVSTTSQVSGVTSNNFTSPVTYTVTAEDGTTQDWLVTVTIESAPSSENDILTYSFAEQTGPASIDAVNHTVDIEVAYGTNISGLVATFSISDLATIDISGTLQISGVTANNFSNPVTYTVTAENDNQQDWVITVTTSTPVIISSFPYQEDFETGYGNWYAGGTNISWEHGIPSAGQTINSAASGNNAWVTNLTGDYNPDEVSYVTSPQFDLSSLNFPKIEFNIWWYAEGFYDGANFQYKLGSGAWKTLGKEESDDSWYNNSYLYSIEKGFGFDMNKSAGWSGDDEWGYGSNGWVTVDHALTGFDYQSANVTFRIGFASNSGYENDGVAIDDINIFSDPTGIDDTKVLLSDIQIYPNPNEGKFRLVYNGKRNVDLNLQLVNLHGQVILSEQIETGYRFSKEFELDYLPPGIYYFRLIHKEDVIVKKMVVR